MADHAATEPDLAAGDFSSWLDGMQRALHGLADSDVPCGACIACCTSSQFIHIAPDEHDALAHIPKELLFPAPRLPKGHVLMGYDQRGHCPMLIDHSCSIYAHRPRTCRTYDCRVFPAAAVTLDEDEKVQIAAQARRWEFSHPTELDRVQHEAVRAAAAFISANCSELPADAVPATATAHAVLAVELHGSFLAPDSGTHTVVRVEPSGEAVRLALRRRSTKPT